MRVPSRVSSVVRCRSRAPRCTMRTWTRRTPRAFYSGHSERLASVASGCAVAGVDQAASSRMHVADSKIQHRDRRPQDGRPRLRVGCPGDHRGGLAGRDGLIELNRDSHRRQLSMGSPESGWTARRCGWTNLARSPGGATRMVTELNPREGAISVTRPGIKGAAGSLSSCTRTYWPMRRAFHSGRFITMLRRRAHRGRPIR